MSKKCMRRTKNDLLEIWKGKNPKKPNRSGITKGVLCDLLKNEFKFQINSAVRKPLSIAVSKSDVKANWKSRLKTLRGYIETTGRRTRVKVIGKGAQGTATLMRTTLVGGGGVLNFVEKMNIVIDEDYFVLSKFSKAFVRLLDNEEHVINDKSDYRTYDIIFKNKRALTVEPMIELAGLLFYLSALLKEYVQISPSFMAPFCHTILLHSTWKRLVAVILSRNGPRRYEVSWNGIPPYFKPSSGCTSCTPSLV